MPVKRLALSKTRLHVPGHPAGPTAAREALALAFACDVVTAGLGCPLVTTVLVVTDDPQASAALAALGALVVPDLPDAGLNPALSHGADLLRAESPDLAVATVSSDLPAATAGDLTAVLSTVEPGQRGFVPDAAGTGTTLLAAGPGAALLPAYGAASRERHRTSGATELTGPARLRRDVDTADDLAAAVALGVGPHTTEALAALSFT